VPIVSAPQLPDENVAEGLARVLEVVAQRRLALRAVGVLVEEAVGEVGDGVSGDIPARWPRRSAIHRPVTVVT